MLYRVSIGYVHNPASPLSKELQLIGLGEKELHLVHNIGS